MVSLKENVIDILGCCLRAGANYILFMKLKSDYLVALFPGLYSRPLI